MFPAGSVIRKELFGLGARQRLRHEVEILGRLSGVDGVVQLAAEAPLCPGSVLLADAGGTVLSERITPLDPVELMGLAAALAHAVAGMHRRGVMLRDAGELAGCSHHTVGRYVAAREAG